jgi:hypothetical protein
MWFEYPELPLLFLIARMCSLYLIRNVRLVCPMYFSEQSINFILYTPLFSYSSLCEWGFTMFCIVFLVWNATFNCASLKCLAIFFVTFTLYVKISNFMSSCCVHVFLLCLFCFECLKLRFLLYSLLCNVSCIIFS